ncbi:restriction endonuclease subunit S [Luteolibacter flavescens]|uniref:Restriction endonuclease subunit S n=1 Tax=Luteolibacter flavescens TaxID=1859460 RepID=A0ABT3FTU9_9BACT|nr:restriction endonuclease subunit S [Luteolibacter flavescens]MCW1887011.1 restriction endonuclease subunit S [Luteolibacter flavescens]
MSAPWPIRKLRQIADVRASNVDKKTYPSEVPVKLCNYMDVYSNEYVTGRIDFMVATATPEEIERFGLVAGDVVITKDSETPDDIGIPAVISEKVDGLVCGYHLALIRPKADELDSVYLAKQRSTSKVARYFSLQASGSTRYGLPVSAIESVEIPTPLKPEQTKIAEILSTVDRAIEQTEALIAKQQRLKTGLMQDLLTHGIDEHGNLRSEKTHKFKDSPLGRIPMEWEVSFLDSLSERGSGHTPSKRNPSYWNGGVKWVSLADSSSLDRLFIHETEKEISELGLENSSAVLHPKGTVILSRDAGVGKSAILGDSMAVSQHFMAWRCKAKCLENTYLYYWLQRDKKPSEK